MVLTIHKQPNADTRKVTDAVLEAVNEIKPSLPADVQILPELYQQKEFIDLAIENVIEALRDGGILVVIILFLFLLNLRTTFITLTAIPLSIVMTAVIFAIFGMSINTMTLGGLAVAIGELVDDAIVDVENIFRRLRENRHSPHPKPPLQVVFQASSEVRNSIVFSTMIVVLVFVPLFALSGMEGRLFTPLGIAYIVSILASLLVSLTVTPVLSYWLLGMHDSMEHEGDGFVLRSLKALARQVIRFSLAVPALNLLVTLAVVAIAMAALVAAGARFPAAVQRRRDADQRAVAARHFARRRRTKWRATSNSGCKRSTTSWRSSARPAAPSWTSMPKASTSRRSSPRSIRIPSDRANEVIEEISEALADIPGIVTAVEQPLAHLISHMLSGVKAQVAIKLYGDDLDVLRREAEKMQAAIADVHGVRDLQVEQQVNIPQLRIEADGYKLEQFGLRRLDVNEFVETAMQGEIVSEVLDGQRTFDLLVRLDEPYREDLDALKRLVIKIPSGGTGEAGRRGQDLSGRRPEHDQPRAGPPADHGPVQCSRPRPGRRGERHQGATSAHRRAAADRLFHRVQRPVRKPAVGLADDRHLVRCFARRACSWCCTRCSTRRICRCR